MAEDLRDLDFTLSQTEDQSSRVCSHCSNQVRGTRAGFSSIKASFQESEHDDDRFRFLKYRNVRITSSLCFSHCFNLIIDNTSQWWCNYNSTFFFLRLSFRLPRKTAKLNFLRNPWEKPPQHPFAPGNPKQPGAALLWVRICLKIVPNSRHSLHSDTKDNYDQHGQHMLVTWLHPKLTTRGHFDVIFYVFYVLRLARPLMTNASTGMMRAWWVVDGMMTGWWWENRHSANGNLLFLEKAKFHLPKDVYRPLACVGDAWK